MKYNVIKVVDPLYLHIKDVEEMEKGEPGTGYFLPPNEDYIKFPPEAFQPVRMDDMASEYITVHFILK